MSYHTKAPEFIADLVALTTHVLCENLELLDKPVAELAAQEIAKRVIEVYAGTPLYIAKGFALEISARDIELYEKYDGTGDSARRLAREYGISIQWVYRIIKRVRFADMSARQPDLFTTTETTKTEGE